MGSAGVRHACRKDTNNNTFFPKGGSLGGWVFELLSHGSAIPSDPDYAILTGFNVPFEEPYFSNGADPQAMDPDDGVWFFPKVGENIVTGQIANARQSWFLSYEGTSMTMADLTDPATGLVEPHVVVGTTGGYVYAILPAEPGSVVGDELASTLSYASTDLGWKVIGLDAGDVDGDGEIEIVAGTWVDGGTYEDWRNDLSDRNRGHLLILDPEDTGSGPRGFETPALDLNGDTLFGERKGIGTGVFGVKLDDVNNDGRLEIWCGDAVGHIYCSYRDASDQWQALARSGHVGAYPGIYNHIFPIKDSTTGETIRLVVQSSGYVMAFTVDPDQIPYTQP